jgi:hypothetical protein
LAHAAKVRWKHARKALKLAKQEAKKTRKEARIALKEAARRARKSAKSPTSKGAAPNAGREAVA